MSDTDGMAGAAGASESGTGGGEYSTGAETVIKSVKDQAYEAIVHSEDISTEDYVEETRDREAEKRGDPEVNSPLRRQRRAERLQRALEAAGTADVPGRQADANEPDAHHEPSEAPHDWEAEIRRRDDSVRATAQYEMRAASFSQQQPDYHDTIQSVFSIFPPSEHIADALLRSPFGPQIAYELANNVDAIEQLNAMPPNQAIHLLAKAEGMLLAQQQMQGQQAPQVRRPKAPPPMKALSGGAGPPSNWVQSDDMEQFAQGLKKDLARRAGRG